VPAPDGQSLQSGPEPWAGLYTVSWQYGFESRPATTINSGGQAREQMMSKAMVFSLVFALGASRCFIVDKARMGKRARHIRRALKAH